MDGYTLGRYGLLWRFADWFFMLPVRRRSLTGVGGGLPLFERQLHGSHVVLDNRVPISHFRQLLPQPAFDEDIEATGQKVAATQDDL